MSGLDVVPGHDLRGVAVGCAPFGVSNGEGHHGIEGVSWRGGKAFSKGPVRSFEVSARHHGRGVVVIEQAQCRGEIPCAPMWPEPDQDVEGPQ
jgi:hypothetical protein